MLIPKKITPKRRTALIAILAVAVGVIGYVLLVVFDVTIIPTMPPQVTVGPRPFAPPAINTEFTVDFITKQPFTSLQRHGDFPVEVDVNEIGRSNPFIPDGRFFSE
ncbi:MAG: hypothetical protein A2840_00840 [Candidatus Buchananbacteria bacterium RIFCSPHIGHO2_01_FULL_47_11b]|uniref:Uncharacterized protein n=1 Tax=Candidatus Buchananbacteria bacterium RIFCSPHIGHO2_01_FULL_47_11b TaxID=1797537 RepID=A0A1G1Y2I5_9BACT|nr:MAG: hypothetical protein A2840_00840 [Candidatus Buchananbacteria bacterium RIFCSPHIGHO2_01_FULL_47_11b]